MAEADFDDGENDFDDDEQQEAVVQFQVRVVYPFASSCDVELNIKPGDIINVLRTDVGAGWWEGEMNGVLGLFPEKYTERVEAAAPAQAEQAPQPAPRAGSSAHVAHSIPQATHSASSTQAAAAAAAASEHKHRPMGRNPMGEGPCWAPSHSPLVINVTNPTKGSKYSGIKQFTVYEIVNTNTNASVTRRFKHFAWLHARLVGQFPCVLVPPIPEKQIQGRFDDNFVEQRRRKLQRFITRVAQHPVLGNSSVFLHFLSASDQKTWKTGKRTAESEATTAFLGQITPPGERPTDTDSTIGNFVRFFGWFDKQIHHLGKSLDEISNIQHTEAAEYLKCSNILVRFGDAIPAGVKMDKSDFKPGVHYEQPECFRVIVCVTSNSKQKFAEWWPASSPSTMADLMTAMGRLGDGLARVSTHVSEFQDQERQRLYDLVREYIGIMKGIVKSHDTAWHDYNAASMKETTTVRTCAAAVLTAQPEQRETLRTRCNTMSCVVLSEFRHFHEYAVHDFRDAVRQYARGRVEHHRQAQELWQSIADSVE